MHVYPSPCLAPATTVNPRDLRDAVTTPSLGDANVFLPLKMLPQFCGACVPCFHSIKAGGELDTEAKVAVEARLLALGHHAPDVMP